MVDQTVNERKDEEEHVENEGKELLADSGRKK